MQDFWFFDASFQFLTYCLPISMLLRWPNPPTGVSDVGQGYYGPKTADWVQVIKPTTNIKIMLWGQGIKPRTYQKDTGTRSGDQTLDQQKDNAYGEHKTCMEHMSNFHMELGCWTMNNGKTDRQWLYWPENRRQTYGLKKDESVQKRYVCWGTNLLLVTHHVPSLCRCLHTTSSYSRMPVETCYKNICYAHQYDECMMIVFCRQFIFIVY